MAGLFKDFPDVSMASGAEAAYRTMDVENTAGPEPAMPGGFMASSGGLILACGPVVEAFQECPGLFDLLLRRQSCLREA
jgi:hypothetical protein